MSVENYENRGLKLTHPKSWKLVADNYDADGNRYVTFDLSSYSTFSVGFYKGEPIKMERLIDNYANKLAKSKVFENTPPKIENISIAGFHGATVSWTTYFMEESKTQGVVIQMQKEPFPVFIDAYLYNEDIEEYWKHIELFIKSITFDPNKIEME